MAFTGIATVVYGAPDLTLAKKLFSDWGLKEASRGKTAAVFITGAGGQVIACPENTPGLPPRISEQSNFREIVWGVSDQKHLVALAENLARDRAVTLDKAGTLHTTDDSGVHIGFRLWKPAAIKAGNPTIYNQPRLLVMDEATSHLDVQNEHAVNQAIRQIPLTRVMVAHRPDTIAMAERLIVLANGQVQIDQIQHPPSAQTDTETEADTAPASAHMRSEPVSETVGQ